MTLDQLRIFLHVAQTLNMTQAAQRLHLSQPAVSAAIAALEQRHAMRLFDRVGRGLELSEAGRAFLPEARAVLARAEEAHKVLEDLAGLMRGEIRIAASQTVATYWLPPRMARFAAIHPQLTLSLTVGNSAQAAAAVLAGEADLGFVEGQVAAPSLVVGAIGGDQVGLYAARAHRLAGRPLGRDDLLAARWVLREVGSGTRDHLAAALERDFGLRVDDLDIGLELPSNGAVLEAIGAGGLVTVASDLAADARIKAGLIERLDYPLPARPFYRIAHSERRPGRAAAAFSAFV